MKKIRSRIEILSRKELLLLHQTTLEILSEVGCRLPNERLLRMLEDAGAQVDYASARVLFPSTLVAKSIKHSKRINQKLENKPRRLLKNNHFSIFPGNQAVIVDYQASSRRLGTIEDVIKGIVLCNELPFINSCMPLVTPTDVPPHIQDLYGYYLCALYSKKPYSIYILSPESARKILQIQEIVKDEPRRSNDLVDVSYLLEPNGSLSYDEFSLEMMLIFADSGHPITHGPMVMAGMDAPITLAATLALQNAHNLIGIILCSLFNLPGSWSGTAHTLDMRNSLCSFGSPNQILLAIAAIQLGEFYGFKVGVNSALTDACVPDFQGGFEKGMSAIAAILAGASGVGAQGIVGADQGTSFEQLVIDNEWASAVDHILDIGFEVTQDTLAFDVIKKVGILGSYISEEHTVAHMRNTYWAARIFNQKSWDAWKIDGGKDAYTQAHEKVLQILEKNYPPSPIVSSKTKQKLDKLIQDAGDHPELFEKSRYSQR